MSQFRRTPPLWHSGDMLRTADDVIAALRARKAELGLSNAIVEEIAGLADRQLDKCIGPGRVRTLTINTLTMIAGALGLAIQLVPDPDTRVSRRWEKREQRRVHPNERIGQGLIRRVRPVVLTELARKGAKSRWLGRSPDERRAHVARMNLARAARRLAGKNKAA